MNDQILMGLEGALKKITPRKAWCKWYAGLAFGGRPVSPNNPDAECFCLAGAIVAAVFDEGGNELVGACSDYVEAAVRNHTRHNYLTTFNDAPDTEHDDVLFILRRAIARRREVMERRGMVDA